MELKFNNVWGGPVSPETIGVVFLVGLILLAAWILIRKATDPRISGMGPVLLLASLAWYGSNTVTIAKLGVQAGLDPMARNLSLAWSLLAGWWLVSAIMAYLVSKHVKQSRAKAAPNNGAAADPGARQGSRRWYHQRSAPGRLSAGR